MAILSMTLNIGYNGKYKAKKEGKALGQKTTEQLQETLANDLIIWEKLQRIIGNLNHYGTTIAVTNQIFREFPQWDYERHIHKVGNRYTYWVYGLTIVEKL